MQCRVEIVSRFAPERGSSGLVYAPVSDASTYRESRVYDIEFEGGSAAVERFAHEVLADAHAQDVHVDADPAIEGASYVLDIGFRPGVLDLERESLLRYHRNHDDLGFELVNLAISRRLYIFGDAALLPPDQLEKDVVNPVIQQATRAG